MFQKNTGSRLALNAFVAVSVTVGVVAGFSSLNDAAKLADQGGTALFQGAGVTIGVLGGAGDHIGEGRAAIEKADAANTKTPAAKAKAK